MKAKTNSEMAVKNKEVKLARVSATLKMAGEGMLLSGLVTNTKVAMLLAACKPKASSSVLSLTVSQAMKAPTMK